MVLAALTLLAQRVLAQPFYGRVTTNAKPAARLAGLLPCRSAYSEINLHFVWHVKGNLPIINERIEPGLYRIMRNYALKTKGLIFHDVGGIETHVHIAVTIPPTLLISEWIGQVKGASSHYINHQLVNRKVLDWQTGYGVVRFGTKDLEWVINYIRNQKEHHKKGTKVERLEKITHDEDES